MVVNEDQRRSVGKNRGLEELPRMDERGREASHGHDVDGDGAVAPVQQDRPELLAVSLLGGAA